MAKESLKALFEEIEEASDINEKERTSQEHKIEEDLKAELRELNKMRQKLKKQHFEQEDDFQINENWWHLNTYFKNISV